MARTVKTSAPDFGEFIKSVPPPRQVIIRTLKSVVEEAAQAASNSETDNAFRRSYARLTIQKGIGPHHAILTISRDISAAAWAM